jgi:hypothetical protein
MGGMHTRGAVVSARTFSRDIDISMKAEDARRTSSSTLSASSTAVSHYVASDLRRPLHCSCSTRSSAAPIHSSSTQTSSDPSGTPLCSSSHVAYSCTSSNPLDIPSYVTPHSSTIRVVAGQTMAMAHRDAPRGQVPSVQDGPQPLCANVHAPQHLCRALTLFQVRVFQIEYHCMITGMDICDSLQVVVDYGPPGAEVRRRVARQR